MMLRARLLHRLLQIELPLWVEKGLVQGPQAQAILADVESRGSANIRIIPLAFYMLGVLLVGVSAITFVAANWDEMPKLAKLVVLFGSMWAALGITALPVMRRQNPLLIEALYLLGVILFGANINLIAQIYNIHAHYPNGVLLWALGGLLVAWLLRSQPAMVAALALATLWSQQEIWDFDREFFWPFLVFWGIALIPVYRRGWRLSAHGLLISLMMWLYATLINRSLIDLLGREVYLTQMLMLISSLILLGGFLASRIPRLGLFSMSRIYGVISTLFLGYLLTFPGIHEWENWRGRALITSSLIGVLIHAMLVAAVGVLVWWLFFRRQDETSPRQRREPWVWWGLGLAAMFALLIGINLFFTVNYASEIARLMNLVYFGGLAWLVYAGYRLNSPFYLNLAFVFFGLTLVSRYFDTFWTLLSRSAFFLAGGLVLIAGGWYLERTRRSLMERMEREAASESASKEASP